MGQEHREAVTGVFSLIQGRAACTHDYTMIGCLCHIRRVCSPQDGTVSRTKRTVNRRIGIKGARDALDLAQHALGGARVRQHEVDGTHALGVQPCPVGTASITSTQRKHAGRCWFMCCKQRARWHPAYGLGRAPLIEPSFQGRLLPSLGIA